MSDRRDELRILVPESERRADPAHDDPAPGADCGRRRRDGRVPRRVRRLDRRAAAAAAAAAAATRRRAAQAADARRRRRRGGRAADGELGRLFARPTTRTTRRSRSEDQGLRLRLERGDPRQAARRRIEVDVISPTGYAVKTMADLGLIMPLTHELIPNLKNISPAFTETTTTRQQVLRAEGLRHHELLLADREGVGEAGHASRSASSCSRRRSSGTSASTSSRAARR